MIFAGRFEEGGDSDNSQLGVGCREGEEGLKATSTLNISYN